MRDDGSASAQLFWERYFRYYDTLLESIPYKNVIDRYADYLRAEAGESILDAGTGTGNVATVLLSAGAHVTGIDFCEAALDRCRRKAPDGTFLWADLTEALPFASNRFDKVACCFVLHNLDADAHARTMSELQRVLKPGGLAAITVFARGFNPFELYVETFRARRRVSSLRETMAASFRHSVDTVRILYYLWRIKRSEQSGAIHFFSREELSDLVERGGFVLLELQSVIASQGFTAVCRKPVRS